MISDTDLTTIRYFQGKRYAIVRRNAGQSKPLILR